LYIRMRRREVVILRHWRFRMYYRDKGVAEED
jgi:hypothetical protein